MREIKQSDTAKVKYVYMVLSIDHITPATGKTVAVNLSKNGAGFGAGFGAVSEVGNGVYSVAGNATDNGTLGPLALYATASGCDPFYDEYTVVAYDPFDSVRLGLSALPNFAAGIASGLAVLDSNLRISANVTAIANDVITAASLATDAVTKMAAGVWNALTAGFSTAGSFAKLLIDRIDAAISSRLASAALVSDSGTAQSGSTTNIRLGAGAPAVTLVGQTVFIQSGTGAGQSSPITGYDTATKDATTAWGTAPDSSSVYVVLAPQGGSSGGSSGDTSTFSGAAASQMNNITTHVNYLGANTPVVLLSPVAQNLNIGPIYTHTDYLNRDGRALFTNITLTNCPDISGVGSSISLNVTVPGSDPAIYPGMITSSTTFYVELTKAQTAVMATPGGSYNIVCTLANGDVIVPITGNLTVTAIIQ